MRYSKCVIVILYICLCVYTCINVSRDVSYRYQGDSLIENDNRMILTTDVQELSLSDQYLKGIRLGFTRDESWTTGNVLVEIADSETDEALVGAAIPLSDIGTDGATCFDIVTDDEYIRKYGDYRITVQTDEEGCGHVESCSITGEESERFAYRTIVKLTPVIFYIWLFVTAMVVAWIMGAFKSSFGTDEAGNKILR